MFSFPNEFKFGVGTAAYQVEGAWNVDGKGESIWDYYCHTFPEKIANNENGDVACNSYNKLDEDIKMLKELKVNFYRFSISWPRLLPNGYSNFINDAGVRYYNNLIDKLLENDIQPVVTLYHWDIPQCFQDIGGWCNKVISDYFSEYARVCFQLFGDRVKTGITINEPAEISYCGYGKGLFAPFMEYDGTAIYLVAHNLLLGHAKAYNIYKTEFLLNQKGKIGISLQCFWAEPATLRIEDTKAAERVLGMYLGWFLYPITTGDYLEDARKRIDSVSKAHGFAASRLPKFTQEESQLLKDSYDFIGLNYYTSILVSNLENWMTMPTKLFNDMGVKVTQDHNWLSTFKEYKKIVPWGLRKLLNWIKDEFNNPEIIITENGYCSSKDETTEDLERVKFTNDHLKEVLTAIIKDKCNITGYSHWSLMDNFEWKNGYGIRFGLYYVNFNDPNRHRTPKKSAFAYQNIIVTRKIDNNLAPLKFLH